MEMRNEKFEEIDKLNKAINVLQATRDVKQLAYCEENGIDYPEFEGRYLRYFGNLPD